MRRSGTGSGGGIEQECRASGAHRPRLEVNATGGLGAWEPPDNGVPPAPLKPNNRTAPRWGYLIQINFGAALAISRAS